MATTTMTGYSSHFDSSRSSKFVSSPLASSSRTRSPSSTRPQPTRTPSFPASRPLRPFASIASSLTPAKTPSGSNAVGKKPVKLIEPPKNYKGTFLLNLTQAEFSRQD